MNNNKKIKIAINGFGRIGRLFFKIAQQNKNIDIVAVNDLGDIENMAYLLNYDSAQKSFPELFGYKINFEKSNVGNFLLLDSAKKKIPFFSIKNPSELPWKDLEVDVVVECTGVFNSFEKSKSHLEAGAKKVVLSGPTKDSQDLEFSEGKFGSTILMGINDENLKNYSITSNASCTTNAVGIPLKILDDTIGIESAFLNTIHSYTASQSIVDSPEKKDFRRGRAAAQNIVPTSSGSATATEKVLKNLSGKLDALSVRVPTISGSLVDITFISKNKSTIEEINNIFLKAEKNEKYFGLIRTEKERIVSSDVIGQKEISIIDLNFTKVQGNLVKILVWYDNESGFTNTLLKQVISIY